MVGQIPPRRRKQKRKWEVRKLKETEEVTHEGEQRKATDARGDTAKVGDVRTWHYSDRVTQIQEPCNPDPQWKLAFDRSWASHHRNRRKWRECREDMEKIPNPNAWKPCCAGAGAASPQSGRVGGGEKGA